MITYIYGQVGLCCGACSAVGFPGLIALEVYSVAWFVCFRFGTEF